MLKDVGEGGWGSTLLGMAQKAAVIFFVLSKYSLFRPFSFPSSLPNAHQGWLAGFRYAVIKALYLASNSRGENARVFLKSFPLEVTMIYNHLDHSVLIRLVLIATMSQSLR